MVHSKRAVNDSASMCSNSVLHLELVLNETNKFSLVFLMFVWVFFVVVVVLLILKEN